MAVTGRFRRRRTGSVYGESVDLDQAVLTLDLLRALGWLVRHGVEWPGRPDQELEHLLIGPPGVFVLAVDTHEMTVDTAAAWQQRADEVLAAATDVAAALPGVPVTPVVCFTRAEPFTRVEGSVFLCSLRNVLEVLSHAPVRIDDATLAAVRKEVTDGLAVRTASAEQHAEAPAPAAPEVVPEPSPDEGPEAENPPSTSYDLYAEFADLDEPVALAAADAGDRIAEVAAREQEHIEAEQFLAAERVAAAEAERAEQERLAVEREEQERITAEEAALIVDARREAERAEAERVEAARRAAAEAARILDARREAERAEADRLAEQHKAEELAAGQMAVEAARMRKARLLASKERAETEAQTQAQTQAQTAFAAALPPAHSPQGTARTFALPQGRGIVAAIVLGVLVLGGIVLQEPIDNAVGSIKALFTERAPARFGEQINVGKTLYHPQLRLRAGQPVALPRRQEVAIPFTVRNGGENAWVLETADLLMLDRVGFSHDAKAGTAIRQGPLLPARTEVAAGSTVNGFLLFDLPAGQTVRELRLYLGPDEAVGTDEPVAGAEKPVVWLALSPD